MTQAVLIKISTQEIIKKANYPNKDIIPIASLDDDLKWLIVNELNKSTFDPFIEKLVRVEEITTIPHPIYVLLDQYRISFIVTALTVDEITDYQQGVDDRDESAQFFDDRIQRGKLVLKRFSYFIYRKVINNDITKPQAVIALEFFYDALLPLNDGYFEVSQKRLNELSTGNSDLQTLLTMAKNQVSNLISNDQ